MARGLGRKRGEKAAPGGDCRSCGRVSVPFGINGSYRSSMAGAMGAAGVRRPGVLAAPRLPLWTTLGLFREDSLNLWPHDSAEPLGFHSAEDHRHIENAGGLRDNVLRAWMRSAAVPGLAKPPRRRLSIRNPEWKLASSANGSVPMSVTCTQKPIAKWTGCFCPTSWSTRAGISNRPLPCWVSQGKLCA